MPKRQRFPINQAYEGKSRPDKRLVVSSLPAGLRPGCLRKTGVNAFTTSEGLSLSLPLTRPGFGT
jgi:hypothetical protein